ncbi:MAG: ABC transporter substrate-binding protein [Pseudomonadota bacterium]
MAGLAGGAGAMALARPQMAFAQTPVTISEAIRLGLYAPLYTAIELGLFTKHGVEPNLTTAGGIAQPVAAILSGAAQVAVTGTGMSVNATAEGAQMINIAKIAGQISVWVVARKGVEFNGVEDFAGKTIATLRFPSNTFTTPTYAMRSAGMDPDADVTFLQLPFGAQLPAVVDGRADLATVFEWDASIGVTQFDLDVVYSLGNALGPAVFTSSFVTERYLDENPEAVQGYCNAIAEAEKILHEDKAVFVDVSSKMFPQLDPAVIETAVPRFFGDVPLVPRNPIITEADWNTIIDHEQVAGTLRGDFPYAQMVNTSFAEKATAEFGLP